MPKGEIIWLTINIIFLGAFIYSAIDSFKLSKKERKSLKFYRINLKMKEEEIDNEFPPSLEKSIINLSKSLFIASFLSALIIIGNIVYMIINSRK